VSFLLIDNLGFLFWRFDELTFLFSKKEVEFRTMCMTEIGKRMIEFFIKKSLKSLDRNHIFLKLKKFLHIADLEQNFDSIYTHALVQYGIKAPHFSISLFASGAVKNAFRTYVQEKKDLSNVVEELFRQYQILKAMSEDTDMAHLEVLYSSVEDFATEAIQFDNWFNHFKMRSSTPFELDNYRMWMKILEDAQTKSFDFQIMRYLEKLRDEFQRDFLNTDLYINLNGETRIAKKKIDLPGAEGIHTLRDKEKLEDNYEIAAYEPLDKCINEWLGEDEENLLIILGEYGTGKTTFCRYITHQMAVNRLEMGVDTFIKDSKKRIPLYFPLHYFEENIDTFIIHQFNKEGIGDINYDSFLKRMEDGQFILILDGFDEMTQKIDADEKSKNFDKIYRVLKKRTKSKIILTTREEYFQSDAEFHSVFKEREELKYRFVHIRLFDDDQIQQYLKKHTVDPDYCWEQIETVFDIHDLAKRPVLLQLIVDYLPDLIREKGEMQSINASDLYQKCIDEELRRINERLDFKIPNRYRLEILQELMVWMFVNNVLTIDVMLLENKLNLRRYFPESTAWEFERRLNEFLSFTFLIREGNNRYRISHKSFRDYLTSRAYVAEINSHKLEHFPKVRTTKEVNRFVLEQKPNKDNLLDIVKISKNFSENIQWQGTNAVSILVNIDRDILKNQDLANCQLSHVDFGRCDLSGTNFQQANLSHCYFNDISILSAYLENVNVEYSSLYLSAREIKDITPLAELKKLTYLDLSSNQITNLAPIKQLKQLTGLALSDNKIKDLTPLMELRQLSELYLNDNKIEDIKPLTELKQLKQLYIFNNKIPETQIQELRNALPQLNIFE
jgi:hypothetical protein